MGTVECHDPLLRLKGHESHQETGARSDRGSQQGRIHTRPADLLRPRRSRTSDDQYLSTSGLRYPRIHEGLISNSRELRKIPWGRAKRSLRPAAERREPSGSDCDSWRAKPGKVRIRTPRSQFAAAKRGRCVQRPPEASKALQLGGAELRRSRCPVEIQRYSTAIASISTKAARGRSCTCLLYTSPSPRDATLSRMPSSA